MAERRAVVNESGARMVAGRRARFALVLATYVAVVALCGYVSFRSTGGTLLWDLAVYERAVDDYEASVNPYRADAKLLFIYHPFVLGTLATVAEVVPIRVFLLTFYGLSTAAFLWQCYWLAAGCRTEPPLSGLGPKLALLGTGAIAFGGSGFRSAFAGNLTTALHLTICAAMLNALRTRRSWHLALFIALVLAFSIIKPYLIAYLLLLCLTVDLRRSLVIGVAVAAGVAVGWLGGAVVVPDQYREFMNALTRQTVGKNDVGFAVFGLVRPYVSETVALLAHAIAALGVAVVGLVVLPRALDLRARPQLLALLWIPVVVLVNPRMMFYDFVVAVAALFLLILLYAPAHALEITLAGLTLAAIPSVAYALLRFGITLPAVPADIYQVAAFIVMVLGVARYRRPDTVASA